MYVTRVPDFACVCDQALMQLALMFKSNAKVQLSHVGLGGNTLGGVAGQCLLRALHDYAAAATAGFTVDTCNCSTGSLEP